MGSPLPLPAPHKGLDVHAKIWVCFAYYILYMYNPTDGNVSLHLFINALEEGVEKGKLLFLEGNTIPVLLTPQYYSLDLLGAGVGPSNAKILLFETGQELYLMGHLKVRVQS